MIAAVLSLILLATVSTAGAQTNSGEIGGVVRDTSGGVLAGATVAATHAASGTVVERVTDGEGRFFLPALRIGQWEVTATLSGFAPETRAIVLEIGRTLTLEFSLGLEGLSQQVTVEATAPLLQTGNAEISDVIGNLEVVQMPLNGRNFMGLAQLSDGVVLPPGGTRGEALGQAGPLPNVGGQRSGHNIYLLDGTKVTDELFNNLVVNPSVDSIEEFKIQKSMYPAEFGGKASALINVATKAGSNRFRGSLFEFHRNDAFDSPNYFQAAGQSIPPLRQNQFGGSLGGPAVQNRTFFFASYEGQRMKRSLTRTFSVPPAAVRAGNFAGYPTVCDPLTIPATGVCTPFPGNQIPAGRIDPIAAVVPAERRTSDLGCPAPESHVRRGTGPAARPVQCSARSPADGCRPAACPIQHIRRGRDSTVRDERASGNARAGVRPVVDDQDAEPRGQPHARHGELAVQRGALRLDDGRRRTAERKSRHRLRRPRGVAGRDDRPP